MAESKTRTTTKPGSDVRVANQHSAAIILPRAGTKGMYVPQQTLLPGMVTRLDKNEWQTWKNMKVIQGYIDRGLLAEVRSDKPVGIVDTTSTDLVIPESLGGPDADNAELEGSKTGRKASVRRRKVTKVTVEE